ncbi:MAG TPA: polyprenyl synthetase family protein [Thermoplasmata archaeon]|nr:polyprenyl synthetase family protein [Thermoplasmata archaeon]
MGFAELARWVPRVEAELAREYAGEARASPRFAPWTEMLREFNLRGGKRFRALLVLAGFEIAARRPPKAALAAAAAMEHFQSWMLIHDDIIDHSDERRGGPTVHRSLEAEHAREHLAGDRVAYGTGVGITLGDLQEPYTVRALLSSPVPPDRRLRALGEYARMARDTAYGQLMDIRNGGRAIGDVSEDDVLEVHRLKTSVYTVAAPLRIGAVLGGAKDALTNLLGATGTALGIAFQLRDDVLGAGFGTGEIGKSPNDIPEGKRTLLVVRAYANATAADRDEMARVLGNPAATKDDQERVRGIIRDTGSLAYSEERIEALTGEALRRVDRSRLLRAVDQETLHMIADRLVHRAA